MVDFVFLPADLLETDSYQMLVTKFLFDAHHYTCARYYVTSRLVQLAPFVVNDSTLYLYNRTLIRM